MVTGKHAEGRQDRRSAIQPPQTQPSAEKDNQHGQQKFQPPPVRRCGEGVGQPGVLCQGKGHHRQSGQGPGQGEHQQKQRPVIPWQGGPEGEGRREVPAQVDGGEGPQVGVL